MKKRNMYFSLGYAPAQLWQFFSRHFLLSVSRLWRHSWHWPWQWDQAPSECWGGWLGSWGCGRPRPWSRSRQPHSWRWPAGPRGRCSCRSRGSHWPGRCQSPAPRGRCRPGSGTCIGENQCLLTTVYLVESLKDVKDWKYSDKNNKRYYKFMGVGLVLEPKWEEEERMFLRECNGLLYLLLVSDALGAMRHTDKPEPCKTEGSPCSEPHKSMGSKNIG